MGMQSSKERHVAQAYQAWLEGAYNLPGKEEAWDRFIGTEITGFKSQGEAAYTGPASEVNRSVVCSTPAELKTQALEWFTMYAPKEAPGSKVMIDGFYIESLKEAADGSVLAVWGGKMTCHATGKSVDTVYYHRWFFNAAGQVTNWEWINSNPSEINAIFV